MGKISLNDKILIESLRIEKKSSKRLLSEFPSKRWSRSGVNSLLRKIDATGSSIRKVGSGQPKSARTAANIAKVYVFIVIIMVFGIYFRR